MKIIFLISFIFIIPHWLHSIIFSNKQFLGWIFSPWHNFFLPSVRWWHWYIINTFTHSCYNIINIHTMQRYFLTSKLGFDDDSIKCGQWASTRLFPRHFVCSNVINWANMRDDFFCVMCSCMLQLKPLSLTHDTIFCLLNHRYYAVCVCTWDINLIMWSNETE